MIHDLGLTIRNGRLPKHKVSLPPPAKEAINWKVRQVARSGERPQRERKTSPQQGENGRFTIQIMADGRRGYAKRSKRRSTIQDFSLCVAHTLGIYGPGRCDWSHV
ncbi:MAG: hypothetical protein GY805_26455 [Chloroflexi bacterium]|nr:hypothetical protein [Chloroflexota bacterium]